MRMRKSGLLSIISCLSSSWGHRRKSKEIICMPLSIACFDPSSQLHTLIHFYFPDPRKASQGVFGETFSFSRLKEARDQVILFINLRMKEQKTHLKLFQILLSLGLFFMFGRIVLSYSHFSEQQSGKIAEHKHLSYSSRDYKLDYFVLNGLLILNFYVLNTVFALKLLIYV